MVGVAKCPVCGGLVELADPWVGLEVECPECGEGLRVVSLQPLQLYYAVDMEEESLPEE